MAARWDMNTYRYLTLIFLLVCSLIGPFFAVEPAQAQITGLSIVPNEGELILNSSNSITLDIDVTNAVELMGFDVSFSYDPSMLKLVAWGHGGMLTSLYSLRVINNPGYLRLAFTQFGVPAVSGDGVLLRLTFGGVGVGSSAVTITNAVFAAPSGAKTYPLLQQGSLTSLYDPTLYTASSLSGSLSRQGVSERGGIPVSLSVGSYLGSGPYQVTTIGQNGTNLTFPSIIADQYLITTAQPRFLNLDVSLNKTKAITSGPGSLPALVLVSGNAVWTDNVINAGDASLVGSWFGKTEADLAAGEILDADVNFDGVVDIRDLALVAGNFGLSSALAYASWVP